jgi:hypothetical protein
MTQDLVEARVVRFLRSIAEARGKGLKVGGRHGAGEQRRLDPVQGVEEVVAAPDGAAAALARIPSPWRASSASTVASGAEAAGPDARPASAPARGAKATLFASRRDEAAAMGDGVGLWSTRMDWQGASASWRGPCGRVVKER